MAGFPDNLEEYFTPFRKNIIGINQYMDGPYGRKRIVYTDWTASGRLYEPIEQKISEFMGPFVANTHTETTFTGSAMTHAYHKAKDIIKQHVNANENDILIACGTGMTGVINKLQRILGFKIHEKWKPTVRIPEKKRPVVFISHMEHHSNHSSWLESIADVVLVDPDKNGQMDLNHLKELCATFQHRVSKIASISACSNVTGVVTPFYEVAEIMHDNNGLCFVDFACSGPYVPINMHPDNPKQYLDAVFLSPHKFLGGPGSTGIVVFGKHMYNNTVPDNPGGGTVYYTSPWGNHKYVDNIEEREDGGTPGFLQTIKAALAVVLKEKMGCDNILAREHELMEKLWPFLRSIEGMHVLAHNQKDRLGIISFIYKHWHFNLFVKLLNDRFGVQVRGGCSCAGTYGHYLLDIGESSSLEMLKQVEDGFLQERPGWVRLSIHPTMTDKECEFVMHAIKEVTENIELWSEEYEYIPSKNDYVHKTYTKKPEVELADSWFEDV
jgi:selenocysteine lyase/cysteine desulfurase